ncbi:MAG: efflux RND transporter permease subunit, partial [Candidatus Margulisiibacteriota bacterium]
MNKIFSYFVKRHMFANVLTIMIILLGLAVLPSINRDTFPSVDLDEVVMVTNYPGSSPEDIELKITNKIEDKLKGIEGIKKYTSFSIENVSLISIILESDADDPDEVKDKIREQVDSITDFPQDLENRPDITEISSSSFPVLEVGLSSKDLTYSQLRNIAKSFKNDLEEIKGVNSVDGYGYLAKEMRITPSPDLLEYYQVSMMDLISTISGQNIRASMGNIVQRGISSTIVNDNRFLNEKDVSNAIVRSNFNGKNIRVSDVAVVRLGFEDPTILSKVSGENGISFNVIKNSSADIITVSNKILDLVKIYQEKYPELTFVTANDFSKYLKNRLKVMINNGILGLILVNLVLWFFLDLRTAFWVSLGIPVAVMGVFFLMPPLDMTINIISLLALIIVIGIIVDDGIIVAENIAKFREEGLSNIESSVQGIQTVFKPVI